MIAIGVAVAGTAVIVFNPIFYMGFLAPHLPTPLLFASFYAMPTNIYTAWDELATRPLSPAWTRVMGARVLRLRETDPFNSSPSRWFEAMMAAGRMPPDLEERFYREGFVARLRVPERVKVGEPFTAQLRVTHVANGSGVYFGVMFGGYAIGDDAPHAGRRYATLWDYEIRPDVFAAHRDVLEQALQADHPGAIRVRAVLWVVYQSSLREELQWQADGTPLRPGTAKWFERIELEGTVRAE